MWYVGSFKFSGQSFASSPSDNVGRKRLSVDEDVQCNKSNDQRPRDSFLHNLEA